MIRLIHASDFHLDSPFSALTEEKALERRREQRQLLEKLKVAAIEKNADIILLSGDLLDSDKAYGETYLQLAKTLSEIPSRIFIAPGNHDYYSARSPYAVSKWPENVHIFKTMQVSRVCVPEMDLTVWGAAFFAETSKPLLRDFEVSDKAMINVMALHGDLRNVASNYNPISENEICCSGLDYLALGHQHAFSGLQKAGGTYYAYPGCPEGRGFDETGEKGIIYAQVDKTGCKLEFLPLGGRRYEILEVDLSRCEDIISAVDAALPCGSERDIYRLILKGVWNRDPDIKKISELFENRFYSLEVRDSTDIRSDIWAQTEEDTLRGLFLKRMKKKYEMANNPQERETIILAVRFGLAALDNREEI